MGVDVGSYLANPLLLIIQTLAFLVGMLFTLRFFLQVCRASFYNPLSQAVNGVTNPILWPLRRLVPASGRFDWASLLALYAVMLAAQGLMLLLVGGGLRLGPLWVGALIQALLVIWNLFFWGVILRTLVSWFDPYGRNPMVQVLDDLTAPLMRPVQRLPLNFGGIDFSPVLVILGLQVLKMLALPPLQLLAQ